MNAKIIFILTPYIHDYIEENLKNIKPSFKWEIIDYINFRHLSEITTNLSKNDFDKLVVSGSAAKSIVEKVNPDLQGDILTLETDLAGIYRLMLQLISENKTLEFNRVGMDFFTLFDEFITCDKLIDININKLLGEKYLPYSYFENKNISELISTEEIIKSKILSLWENGNIDYIICVFSSLMPFLKEKGINSSYGFPSIEHIKGIVEKIEALITVESYEKLNPAAIKISIQGSFSHEELDWQCALLQKHILDYAKNNFFDFVVKAVSYGLEIYTNKSVVSDMTKNYTQCDLSKYLIKVNENQKVSIGYGIGKNLKEARNNAVKASRYGLCNGGNFLINEEGEIKGPLDKDESITYSLEKDEEVSRVAKQTQLSEITIQKIFHIIKEKESYDLYAQDFVDYFGGSIRNANRVFGNLEKAGIATVDFKRSKYNVGRPAKVYHILKNKL